MRKLLFARSILKGDRPRNADTQSLTLSRSSGAIALASSAVASMSLGCRLRYSTKCIFTIVTTASIAAVMVGEKLREKNRERRAVAAIESQGGWVAYDWHVRNLSAATVSGPPGPHWARAILGQEFFATVAIVDIEAEPGHPPLDLEFLEDLPHVSDLRLNHAPITADGLSRILKLPIRRLALRCTSFPEGGWRQLARLTRLHELHVFNCHLSDRDVDSLDGLDHLEKLSVNEKQLTTLGFQRLQRLLPRSDVRSAWEQRTD